MLFGETLVKPKTTKIDLNCDFRKDKSPQKNIDLRGFDAI
jgi:hypothetical protein